MRPFARGVLAILLGSFLLSPVAEAHGLQSALQQRVGDYLVDVGYDAYAFESQKETVYNFALIANADSPVWEFADFNEVRVRYSPEGKQGPEKIIKLDAPLLAYTTYTFPADGRYDLRVGFYNDGKPVAEASFPIQVGSTGFTPEAFIYVFLVSLNVAFLAILFAAWHTRRKQRASA